MVSRRIGGTAWTTCAQSRRRQPSLRATIAQTKLWAAVLVGSRLGFALGRSLPDRDRSGAIAPAPLVLSPPVPCSMDEKRCVEEESERRLGSSPKQLRGMQFADRHFGLFRSTSDGQPPEPTPHLRGARGLEVPARLRADGRAAEERRASGGRLPLPAREGALRGGQRAMAAVDAGEDGAVLPPRRARRVRLGVSAKSHPGGSMRALGVRRGGSSP